MSQVRADYLEYFRQLYVQCMGLFTFAVLMFSPRCTPSHKTAHRFEQGMYVEAESLYERSQTIREKVLGPEHPDVARALNDRASLAQVNIS